MTPRNEHLLRQLEVDGIYMAEEMNETESQELSSWHAFRESYSDRNYVEY